MWRQLIFPHFCVCCGKFGFDLCLTCGQNLILANTVENCSAAFFYHPPIDTLIYKWKYENCRTVVKSIAKLMVRAISPPVTDYLTFIPAASERLRERGFNQAQDLATELSKIWHIPTINLLEKTNNNKHQASLTKQDRQKAANNLFQLNTNSVQNKFSNKSVTIVDDVYTTGATLNAAMQIIANLKPKNAAGLCFAYTPPPDIKQKLAAATSKKTNELSTKLSFVMN